MSTNDRWLLPRRQTEFPARGLLPEDTLHHRRETAFLALAALFLVTSAALVVLGIGRAIDVSALLSGFDVELPSAVLVPLGVLPFAASFVAGALVCHLFGRRRASALVGFGALGMIGLAGLMRAADVLDGGQAFGAALAVTAAYLVGHATNVLVFDRLRARSVTLRIVVAAIVANVLGWSAFAGVLRLAGGYVLAPIAPETILALGIGAAAASLAVVLVLAIPAAFTARGLAVALRVGRDLFGADDDGSDAPAWASARRRLPQALIVDEDDDSAARPRARRASLQPYSSAEMRFFADGDALAD